MIQSTAIAAMVLALGAVATTPSHADTEPANQATAPNAAALIPTAPELDAFIDENADFSGLDYPVPANIERRPAVLPPTAAEAAILDDDSDAN